MTIYKKKLMGVDENINNNLNKQFDNFNYFEFDGKQHFEPIEYFGGVDRYLDQVRTDKIKDQWVKEQKIELLRISYKDIDNIEDILRSIGLLSPFNLSPIHTDTYIIPPYPM